MVTIVEENAAIRLADYIVSSCRDRKDVEGCVACRVIGLQYINDLIKSLPDGHRYKKEQEELEEITGTIQREAMNRLK